MPEHMTIAEWKASQGGTNANARKGNKRSRDKEKLGQYLLAHPVEWQCAPNELGFKAPLFKRQRKFDYANEDLMIAIEFEGGAFVANGGHTGGMDYTDDCVKYSEAAIAGWMVIRITAKMVQTGDAFDLIERAVRARSK